MIGRTISHYRIVEILAEGGIGVVYKAVDTVRERSVALKFLADIPLNDSEAEERFLLEARAVAALCNPNVSHYYEIGEAEGTTFLTMEFVYGETLENRIAKGPLMLKDVLGIGHQLAECLQAVHENGIVHRNIRPANILLDAKGHATLMGFGPARLIEAPWLTNSVPATGVLAYMSPEQARGMKVDHRTDIWAVGCVLYEMVCGQRSFKSVYYKVLVYEIVHEEPDRLTAVRTGIPIQLELIVGKCLSKAVEDRYCRAAELAKDLRDLSEKLKSRRSTIPRTTGSAVGRRATEVRENP